MATEFKLSYTGSQINEKLRKIDSLAEKSEIPTKTSQLTNDSGFLTSIPSEYVTESELNAKGYLTEHQDLSDYALKSEIPDTLSDLEDDATHRTVTDAEKSIWSSKSDFSGDYNDLTNKPTIPSISGLASESYVDTKIAAIPTPDVSGQINTHNTATDAHNYLRLLVEGLTTRLNTLANSDDTTLDQMNEVVAYIKNNKTLIDGITTNKVNVADIIDNLTTNVSNKPLSAAQGVALKALIDAIVVPTKVSELTNDSGYLTQHQDISGKLDASALPTAINTALAQAKASGEFDGKDGTNGKDGTSVTVKSVSESTADGGSNVVTFSDGKTVTIKNGSKGSTGATGNNGADGKAPVRGTD